MSVNLYNSKSQVKDNQAIYDDFNGFIFSSDRNVFNKLISKLWFYQMTSHLAGDIVECGVFKGSGVASWLKILNLYEPHSIKKVLGLDFFDPGFVSELSGVDAVLMQQVFDRDKTLTAGDVSLDAITEKLQLAGFAPDKYELVEGDVSLTSKQLVEQRPGFRISVLYLDMDIEEPTYNALNALWDNVVPGGVVVFDEYAYHSWSEANAVDRFIRERGLQLNSLPIKAPTGYIIK